MQLKIRLSDALSHCSRVISRFEEFSATSGRWHGQLWYQWSRVFFVLMVGIVGVVSSTIVGVVFVVAVIVAVIAVAITS